VKEAVEVWLHFDNFSGEIRVAEVDHQTTPSPHFIEAEP
jgi:hypothetical protein